MREGRALLLAGVGGVHGVAGVVELADDLAVVVEGDLRAERNSDALVPFTYTSLDLKKTERGADSRRHDCPFYCYSFASRRESEDCDGGLIPRALSWDSLCFYFSLSDISYVNRQGKWWPERSAVSFSGYCRLRDHDPDH